MKIFRPHKNAKPLLPELKIVYEGPPCAGKAESMERLYEELDGFSEKQPDLYGRFSAGDRILDFEIPAGPLQASRLKLFTVSGQDYYPESRRLVLEGVSGLVFVVDSRESAQESNQEALETLKSNLLDLRLSWRQTPMVFQWNKQDLPDALPPEELDARYNELGRLAFSSIATHNIGVVPCLTTLLQQLQLTQQSS